jgi:diaminopimelate epimerase
MDISFYKLNMGQNDTLLVNALSENSPLRTYLSEELPGGDGSLSVIARRMCRRRRGVGATGIAFLFKGAGSPVSVRYFLPGGGEVRITPDALSCLARFAFDSGLSGKEKLMVEAGEELRSIESIDSANFRVSIGIPRDFSGAEIRERPDGEYARPLLVENREVSVTPLAFTDPSYALFYEEEDLSRLKSLFHALCSLPLRDSSAPGLRSVISREDTMIRTWFSSGAAGITASHQPWPAPPLS